MYIEPNSTLQLYKNMVLNKDYSNTLWFASLNAQNSFFGLGNLIAYEITKMSYQRKSRGRLKVELNIGQIYDVNYMRFRNDMFDTPYSTKWFYAFVDSVEYVSNTACYIDFTIDVIQTYMFDWTLNECLIERQHSRSDLAGDNLEIESLELGDIINDGEPNSRFVYSGGHASVSNSPIQNYAFIVGLAYGTPYSKLPPISLRDDDDTIVSGLPSGIHYRVFDSSNDYATLDLSWALFVDFMMDIGQYADSVVSVVTMPTEFVPDYEVISHEADPTDPDDSSYRYVVWSNSVPKRKTTTVTAPTTLNGYTPMNKKLLTYPYCYLNVFNDRMEELELRYELFTNRNNIEFTVYGIMSSTPELVMCVEGYDRYNNNDSINNPHYILSVSGFPQVPYSNDAYKAWLAMNYDQRQLTKDVAGRELDIATRMNAVQKDQNLINSAIGTMGGVGNALIGGLLMGNPAMTFNGVVNAGSSVANGIFNNQKLNLNQESNELDNYKTIQGLQADESRARRLPNSANPGSCDSAVAIGCKGFYIQKKTIKAQFAEKIDKYFNMFGYAMNKVDVPNIHARSRYTYIKTNSSNVTGNIPADDKETINAIFNRGIRFWDASDYSHYGVYPSYSNGAIVNANLIV